MNKLFLTLSFFFSFLFFAHAQNGILQGKISDKNTGEYLISATVQIGSEGAVTDLDGNFKISLAPGEYEATASYVGFEPLAQIVTIRSGEVATADFAMEESANLLETATVTSGKHDVALGEVTVSLDVIKPTLLQSTNQTSLDGLLDKVPGVNMVGDQANIRGGSGFSYGAGSRVLLLIDDIPIYQADAGFPQWEDVPLEIIDQVEVVKGAASALYGSSALNGIINVRTGYAKSKPETELSTFYTTFSDPQNEKLKWWDETPYSAGLTFSHKRKIGKLDIVAGGRYHRANSVQDSSFTRRGRLTLNGRYRITDRLSVGVNTNFNKSKGASFFFWKGTDELYRPGANISESQSSRFNIDPFITYFDKADNRHKVMGRFFSVNNNTGTVETDQSNISDVYYGEYQFQRKMEKAGLVLTTGGVYTGTKVRAPLYGDTTYTSRNLAYYLQLDKKFFDKLTLSAGFRFEDNAVFVPDSLSYRPRPNLAEVVGRFEDGKIHESKPVFRFGANYKVADFTFLRASWGQGYRFPTIAEKFITTSFGGIPITPNYDLKSETGWSTEVGVRQGFKAGGFQGFLDASAFWMEYQDMMEFTFVNQSVSFQSQNIGDTRVRGFEASVTGQGKLFGLPTTLLAGYTYIDPTFKEFDFDANPQDSTQIEAYRNAHNSSNCLQPNDPDRELCQNVLKYRYRHTAKFDMESRYKNLSIGVAMLYTSFMENIDAAFESPFLGIGLQEWRSEHNNGALILNLRGAYNVLPELKISLLVNNVTNKEYSNRPAKLEAPRNFTLRADYKF